MKTYTLILILSLLYHSGCAEKKKRHWKDDGKIQQKSSDKSRQYRLWFTVTKSGFFWKPQYQYFYNGHQVVSAFDIINPNSLPGNRLKEWSEIYISKPKGEVLHHFFIKSHIHKGQLPQDYPDSLHPEYKILEHRENLC